ncbi:hypothetical protein ACS0TY_029529 [Phlomoides rotata]
MPRKRLFHDDEKSSASVLKSEESRTTKGKAPIAKLEFGQHKFPPRNAFPPNFGPFKLVVPKNETSSCASSSPMKPVNSPPAPK